MKKSHGGLNLDRIFGNEAQEDLPLLQKNSDSVYLHFILCLNLKQLHCFPLFKEKNNIFVSALKKS